MRWQWWIWVSLSVPLPLTSVFFWAEKRQSRKDEMEMDTRLCLEMTGELRKIQEGRSLQKLLSAVATSLSLSQPPSRLQKENRNNVEEEGGWAEAFSLFSSSLFFTDSSGKIISGPYTAWSTEVSAVTRPQSGLVHCWQFLGTTGDPTETCIGSSWFVLLPSLVSHGLQVLLKPLRRVLLCCDVEDLMCIILEEFNRSISQHYV